MLSKQAVRVATQYASAPASWQYLRIYSPGGELFRHNNIFVFICQVAPVLAWGYLRHQQQVDLWPFDLESGVRVTCDVGYLCANLSLPRPLCSRVRPNVRDRQTDRRQTKASRYLIKVHCWQNDSTSTCNILHSTFNTMLLSREPDLTNLKDFPNEIQGLSRTQALLQALKMKQKIQVFQCPVQNIKPLHRNNWLEL